MQRSWAKSLQFLPLWVSHAISAHLVFLINPRYIWESTRGMCSVFHSPSHILPPPNHPLWCSVAISHHQRAGRRREPAGGIICQGTWAPWESSEKEHKDTKMQTNKDIMQNLYHFNQLYRLYQLYHRYIPPTNFVRYRWHSRNNCIKKISHQLTMCHNNDNRWLSLIIWKYEKVWVTHSLTHWLLEIKWC